MFNNLMEKLSRKKQSPAHHEHYDECIKSLRDLKQNNSRVDVRIDGYQQVFQSTIITIDRLNNKLVMDELFPKVEVKIKENTKFYCEHHEKGTTISFHTAFIGNTESKKNPAILINCPTMIKHDQRRSNFRLALKPGQTPSAKLTPSYKPTLTGIIKDISNNGLRINIQGNENDALKKGDVLKSCHLNLEKNKVIECQLTVRSKRYYSRPYRHTQIGTEITDIQFSDREQLSHYVNQQQRLQCRLKATDRL